MGALVVPLMLDTPLLLWLAYGPEVRWIGTPPATATCP